MRELTEFLEDEGFYVMTLEEKDKIINTPRIWVDFQDVDEKRRVRLNSPKTTEDIRKQKILIEPGVKITMYQDSVEVEGTIVFSEKEESWVVEVVI